MRALSTAMRGARSAGIATALLLGGCAKVPPPSLYMLDVPFVPEMSGIEQGTSVGVGPVEFPQYLDRPQIITRDTPIRLHASEGHVWAEPIARSTARVLAVTIAKRLDSNRIYLVPQRVRTALDWRVEIDIGRFDGALGGKAVLAVRWSLYRGEERSIALARVSIIEEPVAGSGYEALVAAQTRALTRLGTEIADAIAAGGR